ncbi:MAG: hypothetical protein JJ863_13535 [Deltaproteobacteria bacterium]|nr:hypothetical protein [Deltaproteobacteria bacterium]
MTRLLLGLSLVVCLACGDDDSDTGDGATDGSVRRDAGAADDGGGETDGGGDPADLGDDTVDSGSSPEGCTGSELFCEDFEDLSTGDPSSDAWSAVGNGSLTIVDDRTFAGERALQVHTDENGWAFMRVPFSPPGNSFFGRMRVWVSEFPSAPNWAHYTLVELRGSDRGTRVRPVGGQYVPGTSGGPGAFWGIGADGGPTGDWTNWRTSAPSDGGRWLCVEWELDASDSFVRLSIDGADDDALTVDTNDHGGADVDFVFPTFEEVFLGWQLYQGGPTPNAYDVWIDDVVFDTTRVGCD